MLSSTLPSKNNSEAGCIGVPSARRGEAGDAVLHAVHFALIE